MKRKKKPQAPKRKSAPKAKGRPKKVSKAMSTKGMTGGWA